jgi:molybdate transport system ATP-binding protein
MDKGRVIAAGPLADLQSDPSLPLASSHDAAVSLDGVIEAYDARYGLLRLGVRGGSFTVPAPPVRIGEHRRIRVIAEDVSLARNSPGSSSILNVLPARIVSGKAVGSGELVVVIALGADGAGSRLLSRITQKAWEELGLGEGVNVYAQVKAVSLGPGLSSGG